MVDFQRVHDCFSKAASSYYDDAVMQSKMASRLIDLICSNLPSTNTSCYAQAQHQSQDIQGYKVLEIGCGPGNFTTQLLNKLPIKDLCLNDLSLQMLEQNMLNLYEQGFITRDQQILSMQGHTSKWQPLTQAHEATDQSQATNKLQSFTAICGDARLLSKLKAQAQEHELAVAHGHVQAKAKVHEPMQAKAKAQEHAQADGEVAAGAAAGVFSSSFDLIVSNASFQWFEDLAAALLGFQELASHKTKAAQEDAAIAGVFSSSFDLIVSNASFQWFEDLAAALLGFQELASHKTKAAQEDAAILGQGHSVLAFSSFYAGHFAEVKELTDVGLNYLTKEKVIEALERCQLDYQVFFDEELFSSFYAGHFAEVKELTDVGLNYLTKEKVIEALERCQLDYQVFFDEELQYFNSSVELFRHLHVTGVNGIALTKEKVIEALERCQLDYQVFFDEELQYFNSSVELFRHLHVTGVNGIAATPLSAGSLRRIMREYEERFTEKMGVRLTWHPYYVIAKLH